MTVSIQSLMEAYSPIKHEDYAEYQRESEQRAREGLDDNVKFKPEETQEYIDGDKEELSNYNTTTGKHNVTGKLYDKPMYEFNGTIAQKHLKDHQKLAIMSNLLRHNSLIDARGGGEPHEYATDIQERELFTDYNPKHGILPKFEDLHRNIQYDMKDRKSMDDYHHYLSTQR